jgi:hypothetical protein
MGAAGLVQGYDDVPIAANGIRVLTTLGALACPVMLFGCGGGSSAPAPSLAVCRGLRATATGRVRTRQAVELSGLAASRTQRGVLWAHNDSGERPRVFALRPNGRVLADLDVPGAHAVDWEDIAIRGSTLYLGDIGDNLEQRRSIDVYRVPEPRVPATGTTGRATRLRLRYPDHSHNAETLLVDPRGGEIAIVTKQPDGRSGVYVAPAASATATTTLRLAARLRLGKGSLATAGDVSADGRVIAIRTYRSVFAWRRPTGASLAAALRTKTCVSPTSLSREGKAEALALTGDGRAFFTVPEGSNPTLRHYAPTR